MLNFELYNPVKLVFGKGEIEKVSTLIPKESKILVAYGGGSIFKNGIYDQVKKALEGFNVVERGSVLNVFGDPQVNKLVSLDIDIDLSEKFNVVYLFRFKDITFTCKKTKELNHLTIDSFIHNIENINSQLEIVKDLIQSFSDK